MQLLEAAGHELEAAKRRGAESSVGASAPSGSGSPARGGGRAAAGTGTGSPASMILSPPSAMRQLQA